MKAINNIALAMDDPSLLKELADLFRTMGYNVMVQVGSGRGLINSLGNVKQRCLCVIDVSQESDICTYELCSQIKSRFPANKVICYSTPNDKPVIDKMYENGLDGYISKGTEIDYLLHVVADMAAET